MTLTRQIEIAQQAFLDADASDLKAYEAARNELKRLRELAKAICR